ncbi:MAG: 16S rRNA (cytosine(967)-C(5))-methyltransferase RsmB [Lachnospiraceae bacterium]|nr:16S rRNA (cytosine(967)-C(5))-methyltransferase RsmB [Lachnospiraceae bacterium]
MENERHIILETLIRIDRESETAGCDRILKAVLSRYSYLEKNRRSFINRVVKGTVERRIELDHIIDQFSSVKTKKQKPVILMILRMSVYQLMYMDHVPESAVVNEAVKLAGKKGFSGLKGFVNAVLRKTAASRADIKYPDRDEDISGYLRVKYSCPEYVLKLFMDQYGAQITEEILSQALNERPLYARCNISKISVPGLVKLFSEDGVNAEVLKSPDNAFRLSDFDQIDKTKAFLQGFFTIQDTGSMLVTQLAGIRENDTVMDVCAAPGGKTLHAADLLRGSGRVYSRDVSFEKTELIRENVSRCGFENVTVEIQDALAPTPEMYEKCDVVIADLPCSGLGVLGRKADIKYALSEEKVSSLITLQRDILNVVYRYVKKGGILLFSTCTLNRAENEENAAYIIKNLPFEPMPFDDVPDNCILCDTSDRRHMVKLIPGCVRSEDGSIRAGDLSYSSDGFFISRFIRKD